MQCQITTTEFSKLDRWGVSTGHEPGLLSVQVPRERFVRMLRFVNHAWLRPESNNPRPNPRPNLCRVVFDFRDGNLLLGATDGHRLAMSKQAVEGVTVRYSVPGDFAATLIGALKLQGADDVSLGLSPADARTFVLGSGSLLATAPAADDFPDLLRVCRKPQPSDRTIVVERRSLYAAMWMLRHANPSKPKSPFARDVGLSVSEGHLVLKQAGEPERAVEVTIPCLDGTSGDASLMVDHRYLRAATRALRGELLIMSWEGPGDGFAPITLRDAANPDDFCVVMPMRV